MSGRSRGARDVLAEIRSVINHLEQKDRKLNDELQSLRFIGSGSESDQIKNAQAEITRLHTEKYKLTADFEESRTSYMIIKQENEILHQELDTEKKESERHQNNSAHNLQYADNCKNISESLKSDIVKIQGENDTLKIQKQGLEKDLDSNINAIKNLQNKKDDLENENAALKQNIAQLTSKPASSDQARLQQDNVLLTEQLNDANVEVKRFFDLYEHNRNNATIYKRLLDEKDKENETLKEQNAKFIRGAAAAPTSQSLVSLDPPPPPIAARLEVERAKDDTKDPIAIAKADNSQTNTASQQPAQKQTSYLGAAAGAVGTVLNAIGLGGGGRGTNSVDDSSDEGDDIVAGSPSREPERGAGSVGLHPLYTVTEEVKNDKIGDNTVPAAPVAAASSNNTFGGQPAAASGGGGHAVVDVDEIIKKATEEVQKNKVIDMLKMSLNDMKLDPRLFQYVQKTNNGSLMTKTDPKTKRKVPDMHYKVLFPGMAVSGIPTQQNVDAYCKCLSNEQLNALENLYDIHGSTRAESIDKLVKLKTYISSWSTLLAENRDKLMALCDNKGIPYPEKSISEIAEWFKKHARTDSLRKEIYDILDS